ncbi:hypothetical protein ACFWNN_23820 [Lentzea sp. NPDC058450]|uniref:hypothetical protein n=1 Tax=Lentzea sp. NPDC058450 TaxID=3346505 RepID=UPI003665AC18
MAFDLPPHRELPADVKERMRPDFTESVTVRPHRSRAPLAVAAGVALLIAGGVVVTQTAGHEVSPGNPRVVLPSDQDLARCRAALRDPNWQSTEMAVLRQRKVLHGVDGRFCELTRSTASVAKDDFEPAVLKAGSITYRSPRIIAGVPPQGTTTAGRERIDRDPLGIASAPQLGPESFNDSVVTAGFFVIEVWGAGTRRPTLFFDDRPVETPIIDPSSAVATPSFESGDPDSASPENVLAQCLDKEWEDSGLHSDLLENWEPAVATGLANRQGALIARRGDAEFGYCFVDDAAESFWIVRNVREDPDKPYLIAQQGTGRERHSASIVSTGEYSVVGHLGRHTGTVEVSDRDGPAVKAEMVDGFFLANVPLRDGREDLSRPTSPLEPGRLHVVVRDDHGDVAYEGALE